MVLKRIALGATLVGLAAGALGLVGLTGAAETGRYEEPVYTVVTTEPGYELRQYAGWVEARVTVDGAYGGAVQKGFRVLASYIFGGNQARSSIEMTTPVTSTPSETIAMTTPVTATGEGSRWTVSFMMPREWTLETLPVPDDKRIELIAVEPSLRAVQTFSGRASAGRVQRELAALQTALQIGGSSVVGPVTVAQFNPPWVLGPWRRNEVQLPVRSAQPDTAGALMP